MGVARAESAPGSELNERLTALERELYVLMAEVATAPANRRKLEAGSTLVTERDGRGAGARDRRPAAASDMPERFTVPGENRWPPAWTSPAPSCAGPSAWRSRIPWRVRLSCSTSIVCRTLLWAMARWQEGPDHRLSRDGSGGGAETVRRRRFARTREGWWTVMNIKRVLAVLAVLAVSGVGVLGRDRVTSRRRAGSAGTRLLAGRGRWGRVLVRVRRSMVRGHSPGSVRLLPSVTEHPRCGSRVRRDRVHAERERVLAPQRLPVGNGVRPGRTSPPDRLYKFERRDGDVDRIGLVADRKRLLRDELQRRSRGVR